MVQRLLVPATMTLLGERNWRGTAPLRRLNNRFGLREEPDAQRDRLDGPIDLRPGCWGPLTLSVRGGSACTDSMRRARLGNRKLPLAIAITGLLLAGCTASNNPGSVMMGNGSAYHYSKVTCAAPEALPGGTVNVVLGDMGMTQMMGGTAPLGVGMRLRVVPATVVAGQVSLVATNRGWRTHELVVLPLAARQSAGQRVPDASGKVDESASLGEASHSCGADEGDGIRAGTVGWTTLTLAPGRYELICNLTNHYADGMHQEILVTAS